MPSNKSPELPPGEKSFEQTRRCRRFYAIFPGLCLSAILGALDAAILGIALPTISHELDSGELYIWTINGFYLTTAVVQPVLGQMANIFGRRGPMVASLMLFILGSGICGGASSIKMLISGRLIQGIGSGGITVMMYIIVADIVPLRYRQKYMSIVMSCYALGMFTGPVIGGALTDISWRWIFYLNLPIGGLALVLVFCFLKLKHDRQGGLLQNLDRIDWVGNVILTASVVSILIALTWGGTLHAWASVNVLTPLLIGFVGLFVFAFHQRYLSQDPITPPRLFGNMTSFLGFVLTFLQAIAMGWLAFVLPIYFQVVQEKTPLEAGVHLLATAIPFTPSGIAAGIFVAKTGRYKPPLVVGLALIPVAAGCLTLLDAASSTGMTIGFQIMGGVGIGLALQSALPAIQAPLAEEDVALSSGTWAFVRSFGLIWGGAIPAAIFNSRIDNGLGQITDSALRESLARGGAYEQATRRFITSLTSVSKTQVVNLYTTALRETWYVLMGFGLLAVPLALCVREIPLRRHLNTRFGLDKGEQDTTPEARAEKQEIPSDMCR